MIVALDEAALAEARELNEQLEVLLAQQRSVETLPPEVTRAARREGRSIWPAPTFSSQAEDVTVPTRAGDIRVRVIRPEGEATGVYLFIHGGGWVLGECDEQDLRLAALAEETGLCAASVGYRLAPEHPYPAGPDDCEDATLWLLDGGLRELGLPERLTIGGESAGATLAVTTLVRLRERHGITDAFRGANLVYGCYDLSMTPSQRNWGERRLVLSTPGMRWFGRCYVGDRSDEAFRDPDISPLYAELHDLPPALFTVGDQDPLLDDSLFMAARWAAARNEAELRVWPEGCHGFNLFPVALARAANDVQYEFLRVAVAG